MHRLQQFLSSVLEPQARAFEKASAKDDISRTTMMAASLVESFLWLHLGTEIGAFPQSASREIYQAYLSPFFQSLVSAEPKARDERVVSQDYVAHSGQSRALLPMLGRFAKVLVEKAMRQEEIFSSEQARFSHPDRLRPVFQTFLLLHSRMVTRRSVDRFTYYVSFSNQETWRQSWNEDCTPEQVTQANSEGNSKSALICAGYLSLWNYAVKVTTTAQNLEGDNELSSDLFRLTDRLKEMERWRINLNNPYTTQRFDDVRVRILEKLDMEAQHDDVSRICVKEIRESMDSSFNLWFSAAPAPTLVLEPA